MKPKNHSTYESFVQMNTPDGLVLNDTIRKHMSGPWRVWTVVLLRMNNWGHAPFRQGELAAVVCGKDSASNRQMVGRWMKSLGEMGWIQPPGRGGSTQLCVVVSREWAKRDGGRASDYLCAEPTHLGEQKQRWPAEEATVTDDGCPVDENGYIDYFASTRKAESPVPETVRDGDEDPWSDDDNTSATDKDPWDDGTF